VFGWCSSFRSQISLLEDWLEMVFWFTWNLKVVGF
jgi:hypothetical protein